jgi:hypothetical protein
MGLWDTAMLLLLRYGVGNIQSVGGWGGQKGITSKDGSGDDIGSLSRTTAPKQKR